MDSALRAIETTGAIDGEHQLDLNEQLPSTSPSRVRVLILVSDEADMSARQWLRAAATNPAFSFLANLEEDAYRLDDGLPFNVRE